MKYLNKIIRDEEEIIPLFELYLRSKDSFSNRDQYFINSLIDSFEKWKWLTGRQMYYLMKIIDLDLVDGIRLPRKFKNLSLKKK
jgi:hypothetical protein